MKTSIEAGRIAATMFFIICNGFQMAMLRAVIEIQRSIFDSQLKIREAKYQSDLAHREFLYQIKLTEGTSK